MPPKIVAADISLKSFSCPRCGALADQHWYDVYVHGTHEDGLPHISDADWVAKLKSDQSDKSLKPEVREAIGRWLPTAERNALGDVHFEYLKDGKYCTLELVNVHASRCYSCKAVTLWRHKSIMYPPTKYEVEPSGDMPPEIAADFDEARSILDLSPRGAAALLRLGVQKLCKHLGEPGKNINDDIASLVRKGLDPKVAQALDIVRVVGNDAVHPGTIDLRDDRIMASKLFDLLNLIVFYTITHPKEIAAMFAGLPADKVAAIAKRDGKALP